MSRGSENYRISDPMSHFRFRPEVVVQEWFTPHSKRNHRLSDENIRNCILKMRTSGFIAEKTINLEVTYSKKITSHPLILANLCELLYYKDKLDILPERFILRKGGMVRKRLPIRPFTL